MHHTKSTNKLHLCTNKFINMGLLTPKGNKGDKKTSNPKSTNQQSKFIKGGTKGQGSATKKNMTGGSQRGS